MCMTLVLRIDDNGFDRRRGVDDGSSSQQTVQQRTEVVLGQHNLQGCPPLPVLIPAPLHLLRMRTFSESCLEGAATRSLGGLGNLLVCPDPIVAHDCAAKRGIAGYVQVCAIGYEKRADGGFVHERRPEQRGMAGVVLIVDVGAKALAPPPCRARPASPAGQQAPHYVQLALPGCANQRAVAALCKPRRERGQASASASAGGRAACRVRRQWKCMHWL